MEERVVSCFDRIGILVDEDDVKNDFEIQEYTVDSLGFVSLIVEIENEFGISIPDEFLEAGKVVLFSDLVEMIGMLNHEMKKID